jgi:hypothetical protein
MSRFLISILGFLSTELHAQDFITFYKAKDSSIKAVEVHHCKFDRSLFINIIVWEKDWWEELSIAKTTNQKIAWEVRANLIQEEQSIRSVRQIKIKGLPGIFIEVYGETHMGNGSYYLFELKNRRLLLKANTRSVDRGYEGSTSLPGDGRLYNTVFKNEQLVSTYIDINKDGISDIVFKGTLLITDDYGNIIASRRVRKVLIYRKNKGAFVEDKKLRLGFSPNDY